MSERIDDPNFSDYSWLDDEKRLHDASETPAPQPSTSVEQALEQMPKTLTYRDLAVAHLRKMDGQGQQQDDVGPPEFKMVPAHTVNSGQQEQQLLDFRSHPDFPSAQEKVAGEKRFALDGDEYFRYGGALYKSQNVIPNVGRRLDSTEARQVEDEMARRKMDAPLQSADSPIDATAAAIATSGLSVLRGAPYATSIAKGAMTFGSTSLKGIFNNSFSGNK
ncbi:hypothetical protein [Fundidesulfovibrio agrisoli]|uniref:hypothetical protein n=1 Tax=Fundidesulfovibrio agrisoli TaxID=2922717 RepID=UPI001FAC421F|nr:hypothetical protein [Fundidesulfovibrio agrisoli]